jgi:hypothetical protein
MIQLVICPGDSKGIRRVSRVAVLVFTLTCLSVALHPGARAADPPLSNNNASEDIRTAPSASAPKTGTAPSPGGGMFGGATSGRSDASIPRDNKPSSFGINDTVELPSIRYYVVNQTLQVVLTELAYLAKLNINIDGSYETRVQNYNARGPLPDILDDLGRLQGFVWHLENNMLEITPIRSVLSRTIKIENMEEERIRELLGAAGLKMLRDSVSYDGSTGVLRLKGSPRFVAKAEAAILVAIKSVGEETINVIRYGKNSRTSQPAGQLLTQPTVRP